jgi:hypothetical protein
VKRREFIALLTSAVSVWPLIARAQQPAKLPTIGYLGATTPDPTPYSFPSQEESGLCNAGAANGRCRNEAFAI